MKQTSWSHACVRLALLCLAVALAAFTASLVQTVAGLVPPGGLTVGEPPAALGALLAVLFGVAALVFRITGLGRSHSTPPPRSESSRLLSVAARVVAVLLIILAVVLAGGGWYYSNQLLPVSPDTPSYGLTVLAAGPDSVTLNRTDDSARPGTYSLQWHGGRAVMTTVLARTGTSVTRRLSGPTQGLRRGIKARIDIYMYPSPAALHLSFKTVAVAGQLGPMPAWFIPGKRTTWVITVHGWRESRTEGLRPLPTLASFGLPVLDLTYRNDVGAPASPDHLYGVVLSTARAIGEFGAVSVVAGNVAGQTQTMTLYVQDRFESFDTTGAYTASVTLAFIAILTLLAMNLFRPRVLRSPSPSGESGAAGVRRKALT